MSLLVSAKYARTELSKQENLDTVFQKARIKEYREIGGFQESLFPDFGLAYPCAGRMAISWTTGLRTEVIPVLGRAARN